MRSEEDYVGRRAMEEREEMKANRRGLDRSQGLMGSGMMVNVIVHRPYIKVQPG